MAGILSTLFSKTESKPMVSYSAEKDLFFIPDLSRAIQGVKVRRVRQDALDQMFKSQRDTRTDEQGLLCIALRGHFVCLLLHRPRFLLTIASTVAHIRR